MLLCLVPRPHYSARSKRFRSCGPSKDLRPTHKFSNVRKRRPQRLPAFQYGGAILESEKTRLFFSVPDFGVLERDCIGYKLSRVALGTRMAWIEQDLC